MEQDGRTGSARIEIDVTLLTPLSVNLTADPLRAAVGEAVVFTAAVSGSAVPVERYEWNFGDGDGATTNGNVVNHVYTSAGVRTASVTVVSVGNDRVTSQTRIEIRAAAVAGIAVTASPGTLPAGGGTVALTAKPIDAGGNPLSGVPVSFSADAGTLRARSVASDFRGEARTALTTDRDTEVTASADGRTSTVTVRVNRPPAVAIARTGPTPRVGDPVSFTVTVAAGSSPIRQATIDFGDGATRSLGALVGATSAIHTYRTAGTFDVVAAASDTAGETASVATVLVVGEAAPLNVTVAAAPMRPQVGAPVTFTATVTRPAGTVEIDRYVWDFGDNRRTTTAGNATSHVYDQAGRRVVTVRAVEQGGRVGSARIEIDVTPLPPLSVNLTASPTRAAVGEAVVFTATVSGSAVPVERYEWSFGDGDSAATAGNVVNHVYSSPGTRTPEVRAVDQNGRAAVAQTTIVVVGPAPLNVNLTANPTRAAVGEVVVFTAAVSGSTVPVERYEWSFGDGDSAATAGNIVNHVYSSAGTRTPEVRAVDQNGRAAVARTTIVVVGPAPLNVNLTADPPRATAGGTVVFTATVSSGATARIARYEWDFGDGASATTTGNVVNHVYTSAGVRTARVTVFSVENDRGTSQTTVIVAPARIAVTLTINPAAADAGQSITFTATVTPATAVVVRYDWNFGDAGGATASTTSPATTFAYGAADRGSTRTATVTAVAFDGASVSTQGLVSINP